MSGDEPSICSAVPGMSVPQVRRALAIIRARWCEHTPVTMMRLSDELVGDCTIGEFAFNFVLGHHHKRHKRKL